MIEAGTTGTALSRIRVSRRLGRSLSAAPVSLIPSVRPDDLGHCSQVALAFCFDSDSLRTVLNEALLHASIRCPATEALVFVTSKWDPKVWAAARGDVVLSRAASLVLFVTPTGRLERIY